MVEQYPSSQLNGPSHWVSLSLGTMDRIVRLRIWIMVIIPDLVVGPSRPVVFGLLMKQNKQKEKKYATYDRPKPLSIQSQVLNCISILFHINIDGNRIVWWASWHESYICVNGPAVRAISNLVQYMDEWVRKQNAE